MKNLSHKSFIARCAKLAAVGLMASNLLTPLSYPVFAAGDVMDPDEAYNQNVYSSGADGYTVTYNGVSYTVALSDQTGTYKWGNNTAGDSTSYAGSQYNDQWGGGSDTVANGYNPNPTNYSERKGPCNDGWHVPSRGEWNAIVTAWCHDANNSCSKGDLQHANDWTADNGLIKITSNSTLASKFKSDFGMTNDFYWSSSPLSTNGDYDSWYLYVGNSAVNSYGSNSRDGAHRVRCVKNPTSAGGGSSSSALSWADVESGSDAHTLTAKSFSFIMPAHDVYLYAITAPNTYHVHYDGNGSTAGTMTDSDYTYDTAGKLKPNAYEKLGYTWTGWNTQSNGGGTSYASGATVYNWTATDGETIPIYAQWSVNGYEITYLLNSGTVNPANPDTYTIETNTFTLNNPSRTNSTFLGWSGTAISGMSGTVTIAQGSMGDRTYEANFACNTGYHLSGANNCVNNTYNVVVHDGDGTHGAADPVTFTYDNTGSLPNMPAQSGYDFVGWEVTGMSGGVTHYIGTITTTGDAYTYSGSTNEFMNLTIEQGGTVTLTALWEARNDTKYEVYHYIKDVGTNTYTLSGTDYLSGTTDTDVVLSGLKKTFEDGLVYSGGYLNVSNPTTRPAGAGVTTGNIEKDGSLKIYLYYDRGYYNVYLSGDSGVDTLSGSGRYEYGATVTATATPKAGYHFVRWEKRNSNWTTE